MSIESLTEMAKHGDGGGGRGFDWREAGGDVAGLPHVGLPLCGRGNDMS